MCASKKLISQLSGIRQLTDLHSSCISQQIVERFMNSGEMEHHLAFIRREYQERRDIMIEALNRYAPPGLSWNPVSYTHLDVYKRQVYTQGSGTHAQNQACPEIVMGIGAVNLSS